MLTVWKLLFGYVQLTYFTEASQLYHGKGTLTQLTQFKFTYNSLLVAYLCELHTSDHYNEHFQGIPSAFRLLIATAQVLMYIWASLSIWSLSSSVMVDTSEPRWLKTNTDERKLRTVIFATFVSLPDWYHTVLQEWFAWAIYNLLSNKYKNYKIIQ